MFAKATLFVAFALVAWAVAARPLGAHAEKTLYRVRPYDTLWSIAAAHYAGDAREAVWRIERANRMAGPSISPGEVLRLP